MNKKAAICLHGAIAKIGPRFSTQGSLYNNNKYVNYKACFNSIVKHIIGPNQHYSFDYFIHCWSTDVKYDIISMYHPKHYLFEDNSIYYDEINRKISNPEDFGGASRALSIKKSIELFEEYKKQSEYDVVIVYRPDVILLKDIVLDNYDLTKIYTNGNIYADFHFIMSQINSIKFKNLYASLDQGNVHKYHYWIKNYIENFMHQEVCPDDIQPGLHQEVLRKAYTTMVKKSGINIEKLLEYGLTTEEIMQYQDIYV